jgi:hypothetical protein
VLRGLDAWAANHQPWLVGLGAGSVVAALAVVLLRRFRRPRPEAV